ncbi:MAG: hypothetical protein ACI8Z9_001996, partial [Paraglaciecola sp.]
MRSNQNLWGEVSGFFAHIHAVLQGILPNNALLNNGSFPWL